MIKNILIAGSKGQLGSELEALRYQYPQYHFIFTDVAELDITQPKAIDAFFGANQVNAVINCAAYTAVDKAESEPELAYLVNAIAPGLLAQAAIKFNFLLVHISTDYVFSGSKRQPYLESDPPDPLGVYAKTKFAGEQAIIQSRANAIIFRTSWLYSTYGHNFAKTILHLSSERAELRVVNDQIGSPTYAADLAHCLLQVLPLYHAAKPGIYHFTNEGVCSWYDFALAIVKLAGLHCNVLPIPTSEYPTPAIRPPYSVLDKTSIVHDFKIRIPRWEESLGRFIQRISDQMRPTI